MGNLKSKLTNEEWDELVEKINNQKVEPKSQLNLNLKDKDSEQLLKLKETLSPFYSSSELQDLDTWIANMKD